MICFLTERSWRFVFCLTLKPLLQLVLLTIFLVYFGLPAVQKYREERVMVIGCLAESTLRKTVMQSFNMSKAS